MPVKVSIARDPEPEYLPIARTTLAIVLHAPMAVLVPIVAGLLEDPNFALLKDFDYIMNRLSPTDARFWLLGAIVQIHLDMCAAAAEAKAQNNQPPAEAS